MISNNILAGLVVVAILVSLGATTAIFNTIGQMKYIAGGATGITTITLQGEAIITLVNDNIDFGTVTLGSSDDTSDDIPLPFLVQNDGNVNVDITIEATNLWTESPNPSGDYQFMCGDYGLTLCPIGSVTTWTNMPATGFPVLVIKTLPYQAGNDMLEVEIAESVPLDETPGGKLSTVTLTATEAL